MQIRPIQLHLTRRASDARPLDQKAVAAIAASLKEIGQISPITVVESPVLDGIMVPGFRIVAGNHRVEAAKSIGWTEIDANVVTGTSLEIELIEIDENLQRAELTAAQRTAKIARRKQIWEALHPSPTAVPEWERDDQPNTGATCASILAEDRKRGRGRPQEFAASTAAVTGESKSTINRQLAVANALGDDLQKVEGTSLDKGVELQALAKLPEHDRKDLIERAQAGEKVTAREGSKKPAGPTLSRSMQLQLALANGIAKMLESAEVATIEELADAVRALPERERAFLSGQLNDLAQLSSIACRETEQV